MRAGLWSAPWTGTDPPPLLGLALSFFLSFASSSLVWVQADGQPGMGSLGWAASRCGTTLLCLATCTGSFLLLLKSKQCCGCVRRCSEAVA